MKRIINLIIIVTLILIISGCSSYIKIEDNTDLVLKGENWNKNDQCIASFNKFAYYPLYDFIVPGARIPPLPPWQLIENNLLIERFQQGLWIPSAAIVVPKAETDHIWINLNTDTEENFVLEYMIYDTQNQQIIKYVSGEPFENGIYVSDLFLVNGKIWGINRWHYPNEIMLDDFPIFSIFNEDTGEFELVDDGLTIPSSILNISGSLTYNPTVLVDEENTIWIYINNVGLYSFSTERRKAKKYEVPDKYRLGNGVISQQGKIFFINSNGNISSEIQAGEIMTFDTETEIFTPVEIPNIPWPAAYSLHFDAEENLWFGAVGYLGNDNEWQLVHSNVDEYFLNAYFPDYSWNTPRLEFESSNGKLFFQKDLVGYGGTSWYDPSSNQGCWFTTGTGSIVEDQFGDLWIVYRNGLYKYEN